MVQSLRLRALSRKGEPFLFTPADVPVRVWEDAFILANRPNTPILRLGTVVRVMDDRDIGEGDCVLLDGKKYTVGYYQGFYFMDEDGSKTPANEFTGTEVFSIGTETRSRITFKTNQVSFQLMAFLGMYCGKVLTSHDPRPVYPEDVRLSAGFVYQCQKLFYGDLVEGHPLLLWHGRPCICVEGEYVEIPTHKIIGKEDC